MINPGIWGFLSGARDRNERYITTAYREIREESGLSRDSLTLLYSGIIMVVEESKGLMWPNHLYILRSSTDRVKLDYENADYRWATLREIEKEINYTNVFINHKNLLKRIKRYANAQNPNKPDK